MILDPGTAAPAFALPDAQGNPVTLASFAGRKLVLFFYPKDDTPGCTVEAKDFSALKEQFAATGTDILGVSPQDPKSKAKFTKKHGLSVPLGADEDTQIAQAYGVWGEKTFMGRRYMGVSRATFLIDGEGRIARVWPKVTVAGHAAEVLEAARSL